MEGDATTKGKSNTPPAMPASRNLGMSATSLPPSLSPIAYTIPRTVEASGLSRADIYRKIKSGELRAVKNGKRTLILHKDLQKLLENLPALEAQVA